MVDYTCIEISGADSSTPLDRTASNMDLSGTTSTIDSGTTAATTHASEIAIAILILQR